jgi:hypothetical protein
VCLSCMQPQHINSPFPHRRVPDELRRHSLSDGVGGQYSTNLDRNRYGADDQYLSTVIRYDLEFLRLCPCLVDVEIIDAKNGSGTILVSAGDDFCICAKDPARKVSLYDPWLDAAYQDTGTTSTSSSSAGRTLPLLAGKACNTYYRQYKHKHLYLTLWIGCI